MVTFLTFLSFILFCNLVTNAYNLDDVNTFRVLNGPNNSLFGYSMATYQFDSSVSLLVGSPKFNGSVGAAFRCHDLNDATANARCYNLIAPKRTGIQWLGATVSSAQEYIMVCAPRSIMTGGSRSAGECFYLKPDKNSFQTVPAPPMNREDYDRRYSGVNIDSLTYHRDLCLTGISATIALTSTSAKFITSNPSCVNYKNELPKSFSTGIWIADEKTNKASIERPKNQKDYSMYFGYALAMGKWNFYGSESTQFLAVSIGSHYETDLAGRVNIYNLENIRSEKPHHALNGHQPGEYFGASLAAFDLTGDDLDEIIVGAPFYTDYTNSEVKYDIGAVYVYRQYSTRPHFAIETQSAWVQRLYGKTISGRFGSAVAGIHDTDGDGYNDLAVGAPYENDGSGAVYIFRGHKNGVRNETEQIIYGNRFGLLGLRSFGFAFASGDFDGNGFNDVVVGAPISDVAIYLPARPVINVDLKTFHFSPSEVTFTDKKCASLFAENSTNACTSIKYCFSILGKPKGSIPLSITVNLDTRANSIGGVSLHRIQFLANQNSVFTRNESLFPREEYCFEEPILFVPNMNYRVPRIDSKITFAVQSGKDKRLMPVVNATTPRKEKYCFLKVTISQAEKSITDLPWWVYLLCAIGALLIISVVIGILKKLGFFKRLKPPVQPNTNNEDKNAIVNNSQEDAL